jgi:hypothetical protein
LLEVGNNQERRTFLRAWIRRISVRGYEDVQIEYAFPTVFTDDGSGGPLAPLLGDTPILGPEVNEERGMKGWFQAPERPRAELAVWRVLPKGMNGSAKANRDVRASSLTTIGFPSGSDLLRCVPSGRHDESPVLSVWLKDHQLPPLHCGRHSAGSRRYSSTVSAGPKSHVWRALPERG